MSGHPYPHQHQHHPRNGRHQNIRSRGSNRLRHDNNQQRRKPHWWHRQQYSASLPDYDDPYFYNIPATVALLNVDGISECLNAIHAGLISYSGGGIDVELFNVIMSLANELPDSSDLNALDAAIRGLDTAPLATVIHKAGWKKGHSNLIFHFFTAFSQCAGITRMEEQYRALYLARPKQMLNCGCRDSSGGGSLFSFWINAERSGNLQQLIGERLPVSCRCNNPESVGNDYYAPSSLFIRLTHHGHNVEINSSISLTIGGTLYQYALRGLILHCKKVHSAVIRHDDQWYDLSINGVRLLVDGLDSADIRSYTHFAVYVRTETVQHPEQIDNNSNSNSSIVNNNELSSSVSSATDTAAQHSINLSNPKLSLVPYSDSDDSDDSDSEPGADSDSDSDIPLRSLSPPAIIPSVSSDQTLQQQQEQSNSTPTASTQTVPAKRNHDNAFDDAAPSSPHPPSAATAAVTSSITATSVDSNLDMDELDCMFGHGWRYTRSVPPPSTSSTDTPNDHIGVTSVKKKRKIVDAVSSSDPSTVNTVTSVTASSQTESSAPLLLGESFTTLDGGSISFDELSLELQHYLGKHTYLTLEHQQCIINAWLLIDKRQKQTISSDAAINQHRPQQQQQQQQRIRAAAASSQSSNRECIVFDQPVPTANSDAVIVDEPGLKVCTLNLRYVNGIAFIPFINHYLNKYPIIAFTEFSREMMDGIKMHCKSMASSGNNNNRYEIYGHGRVAMLVNCASVKSVIDVELEQCFAGFCSSMPLAADTDIAAHKGDFANRFAVYNVQMKDGTMQSIAIAYYHSDWSKNASVRIIFGKYIEYCLTRIELHPSRMVVGDFNSVASWMDRARNAQLATAKIEDRSSEEYQCLLKKYREECHHHRESVLLPLSRAGFIDGIHLARCIQGESVDASNISFRFSYYYQLHPVSALDLVFLPPHLLSGAVIQYGPDGGIIPFLDHSAVGLHLPPPATSDDDTLGTIDIPSCYLEALPVPTIMSDIHAPADFHTVTSTFRFDINGSNLGGISMHASASRSSIQHIHPPQSVADCMFLKGITRRGKGKVRSSSFNSSRVTMQKQDRQGKQPQPQHQIQESASSSHLQKHPYTRQQQQIADNSNRDEDYHIDPSFHINKQQLPHSCPHQEQNTTSDPVPTSTAAATVTSVSQWHQQQHQHQGQHRNQNKHQHQQPHPSKPSVSIVTSLLLKGSEIAKPSVPQLPPSDFSISSASSIQQQQVQQVQRVQQVQQQYPLTDTVVDQIKASQPRKTEQQRHQIQQAQQKVQQPLPSSSLIKHVLDHHTNVCQKRDDAILGLFINQLRGLIDETHSLTRLKIVQKTLQILSTRYSTTSSVTTITTTAAATDQSSEEKLNHAIEQLRNVLPGTQSFTKCLLLQEAIDVISLLNSDATLTISAAVAILDTIPAEDGVWPPGNSYMHPKMKMYVTRWILKHEKGTYPSNEKRCALAKVAGVEVEKINSWFKNTQKQIKKRISAST